MQDILNKKLINSPFNELLEPGNIFWNVKKNINFRERNCSAGRLAVLQQRNME